MSVTRPASERCDQRGDRLGSLIVPFWFEDDNVSKLRPGSQSTVDRIQPPLAGDAFELVLAPVLEGKA